MSRRVIPALCVLAAALFLSATNASAAGRIDDSRDVLDVGASSQGSQRSAEIRSTPGAPPLARVQLVSAGPPIVCRYVVARMTGSGRVMADPAKSPIAPVEGTQYWLLCDDPAGNQVSADLVVYDPGNPLGPIDAGPRAAALARASLTAPTPAINTSPPPDRPQIVGLRTWFWLGNPMADVTASATLAGVTATVTAHPTGVDWNPGDGRDAVHCAGSGEPWTPSTPETATTECGHVYETRSTVDDPAGTFPLQVTVHYDVTWQATSGEQGVLEPLDPTATIPLVVHEIQAVIK